MPVIFRVIFVVGFATVVVVDSVDAVVVVTSAGLGDGPLAGPGAGAAALAGAGAVAGADARAGPDAGAGPGAGALPGAGAATDMCPET